MADTQVPAVLTHPPISEMYGALRAEWRAQLGMEPSRASLLVLLAHWSHETANGAECIAWNVAGLKWTPHCGSDFARYDTFENVNGVRIRLALKFRAYATLEAGVADYMRELRGRFAYAWAAVEAADVAAFARDLRREGYYTDTLDNYTRAMRARYAQLDAIIGPDTIPDFNASPDPRDVAAGAIAQAVVEIPTSDDQPTPPGDLPPVTG